MLALVNPRWGVHICAYPEIITDPLLLIKGAQFRFPRSGKKRIRNKWSKREENFRRIPDPNFYIMGKRYICHPSVRIALEYELFKQGKRLAPPITTCGY